MTRKVHHEKSNVSVDVNKTMTGSEVDQLDVRFQGSTSIDFKYKCKYCGKLFLFPSYLERHLKSHTGEKPFVCELCGKSFTRNYGIKKHMMLYHTEASFPS